MSKNTQVVASAPAAPAFSFDNARQLVRAIALANGHPEPDAWTDAVIAAYGETIPAENTLQQETPAV
jgi:hypothetical protein